jgi:hypothetical protein
MAQQVVAWKGKGCILDRFLFKKLKFHRSNKPVFCCCSIQGQRGGFLFTCNREQDHGYTDKKENQIFLIYLEIQSGAVAKSYEEGLPNI